MSSRRLLSVAMLGGMVFSTGVAYASPLPQSHDAPRYTWVNFDGQWLCRSWSDSAPLVKVIVPGATENSSATTSIWDYDPAGGRAYGMTGQAMTRCTAHWHIDSAMRLLSDDADWTPNPTGEWPAASDALAVEWSSHHLAPRTMTLTPVVKRKTPTRISYTRTTTSSHRTTSGGTTSGSSGSTSGGYNPWAPVPGHPSYRMSDFAGDPYSGYFGVCTWYAWYRHRSEPLMQLGNAASWAWNAPKYGLSVGSKPVVGATVVFQPGVEGAGGAGHVAHVESVLGNGWFIISEMNFYVNGGGWGRVDYRYAYVRSGVSFIY
ncbi:MAG: CHAP domain-containing protein [Nitrososphaerota archaeon]